MHLKLSSECKQVEFMSLQVSLGVESKVDAVPVEHASPGFCTLDNK